MYNKPVLFILALALLFSCKQQPVSTARKFLNDSSLRKQVFLINPLTDTSLVSDGGIKIDIAAGTFSGNEKVAVVFKEALDIQSMVAAGLTTLSNGKPLSSAGMFYLATVKDIAIQKPISLSVPTNAVLTGMKLFKGEQTNGVIEWKDPVAITDSPSAMIASGKRLFDANCTSCHRIEKDLTGPALAGVRQRWADRWKKLTANAYVFADSISTAYNPLYEYTKNWPGYMQNYADAAYACCINNWSPAAMNQFPNLSYADMDALYGYIDAETERLGLDITQYASGCDACTNVQLAVQQLQMLEQREKL